MSEVSDQKSGDTAMSHDSRKLSSFTTQAKMASLLKDCKQARQAAEALSQAHQEQAHKLGLALNAKEEECQAAEARAAELDRKIRAAHPMGTSESHTAEEVLTELAQDWLRMTMAGPLSPIKIMDGDIERTAVWEESDADHIGSGYAMEDEHEPHDELKAAKEQAEARVAELEGQASGRIEHFRCWRDDLMEEQATLKAAKDQAEAKLAEAQKVISSLIHAGEKARNSGRDFLRECDE